MDKTEKTIAAAGGGLITAAQTRRLILQAQSAWRAQCAAGLADERDGFDAWRKGSLWDAVSKSSFRAVTQREYGRALGHFLQLAGRDAEAGRAARLNSAAARREASGEGDRLRALHAFNAAAEEARSAYGDTAYWYACSLLQKIHKAPTPDAATARQLWQTVFTLRSRAAAKRKREAAERANSEEVTVKS